MEIVYATGRSVVATTGGGQVLVQEGSHWPADDPIVRQQPSLFSADPAYGLSYSVRPAAEPFGSVEQATAAPGEKRNVRRG
jgi:hypothetical protein